MTVAQRDYANSVDGTSYQSYDDAVEPLMAFIVQEMGLETKEAPWVPNLARRMYAVCPRIPANVVLEDPQTLDIVLLVAEAEAYIRDLGWTPGGYTEFKDAHSVSYTNKDLGCCRYSYRNAHSPWRFVGTDPVQVAKAKLFTIAKALDYQRGSNAD